MVIKMNVCSKCGRVLTGGLVFCDSCGARAVNQSGEQSQNNAPPPPSYNQPPTNYAPPPQADGYNPPQPIPADEDSDDTKKKSKKTTLFIVINIVLGFIGYLIAANMVTFGIGEILMFAAIGFGIAIKKPIGFILAGIDLFMLIDLWFLGLFL
jgi:hypothetical protein